MYDEISIGIKGDPNDRFLDLLNWIIRAALRFLAVLMVGVILWGVADVCWILYNRVLEEPKYLLNINDIFNTFGAFLAVLIAIEIFVNIVLYLKDSVIHVRLVVATALMAVARKIIGFDFEYLEASYVMASAATVFALGVTYWLLGQWGVALDLSRRDQELAAKEQASEEK
jgi:uncharacterized membrane protein (DUF373 family)